MIKFFQFKKFLLVLLGTGLLACSSTQTVIEKNNNISGNQVDTSVTAYLKHHPHAWQDLQENNIKLLQIGDYDRFVLPSSLLFNGLGHRLQGSAYTLLNQVIEIIKAVPKESITIQAYTFDNGATELAIKLTNLQAQAVSDYLISHGIDARLMYSLGMGSHNQVTESPDHLLENYRIEITLEELKTRLPG